LKICAIIVTYNPEIQILSGNINKLNAINISCCVVDNTDASYLSALPTHNKVIAFQENHGIAKAQNEGIKYAISEGYDAIIFFDQDSILNENSILSLISGFDNPETEIAAPVFTDTDKGFYYKLVDITKYGLRKIINPQLLKNKINISTAISSGTLVRTSVFNKVGLMDEDFFIDYVDTEWCLRCANNNILIEINPQSIMKHSIGDKSINLFFFRVPVHSPTRRYYRIRNSLMLLSKPDVPKLLALREILSAAIHQSIIMIFCANRKAYFTFMSHALSDAFSKKTGKYHRPEF